MKRLLSVVFIFLSLNVLGQSIENLKPEDIKNSGKYFYGQSAICDTYEEAEKKARKAMFKNLAATSAFDMIDTGVDRDEQIEKIIESFKTKLENNKYIKVMNVVNDTKNDEYSFYGKLDQVEKELEGKDFIRTHQSYFVNARKIKSVSKDSAELQNGEILPVSKSKATAVKNAYLWAKR